MLAAGQHRQHDLVEDSPRERLTGSLVVVATSAGRRRAAWLAPPPSRRPIAGRLLARLSSIAVAGATPWKIDEWHGSRWEDEGLPPPLASPL
jgi:hypothetical protein